MFFTKRLSQIVAHLRSLRSRPPADEQARLLRAWLMVYASDDFDCGASLTNEDLTALIGGPVPRSAKVMGKVPAHHWLDKTMKQLATP